ncbi:M48 family metallopeptidase [Aliiroseovarius sp.]|uniref:M48 family metallopeptidase n=1 Tax=Aliiroseovarius sp. TaxID=1872442 RepID=UPI003BA94A16
MRAAEVFVLAGEPEVEVVLKPSPRARRLSLRVSRLDGRVTMSVPRGASRREAVRFAQERADWIRGHLADRPVDLRPQPGGTVLFEGREVSLVAAGGRSAKLAGEEIHLPLSAPEKTGARLAALFKALARDRLAVASDRYAAQVGRSYTGLTLRDTRSRWGSCSSRGGLMYSWRLIMAPPAVLDYVAAHEVAHLVHMDHSPAFWAQVERICPDYAPHRAWLREHGAELHRYRFRD